MSHPVISIELLEVHKSGARVCHVPALQVCAGERVAILGPNGSGKSTLLKVLAGLDGTARGRCEVDVPVRDRVYVHQHPYLFKGSVLANVCYGLSAHGVAATAAARTASEWLERLGVAQLAKRSSDGLSGGERRRVALARAFALRPKLLLLDEPLADLDDAGAVLVEQALSELGDVTLLIASPNDLESALVSRAHVMPGGDS